MVPCSPDFAALRNGQIISVKSCSGRHTRGQLTRELVPSTDTTLGGSVGNPKNIALFCVVGTILVHLGLLAPTQSLASGQRTSSALTCARGQAHRQRRFAEKGWSVTIGLDPCVSEPDARRILRAISEAHLVNRQPETVGGAASGRRPDLPNVQVSQVLSIGLVEERVREVAPSAQYSVMTRTSAPSAGARGLYLLVSILGENVEVYLVSGWLE